MTSGWLLSATHRQSVTDLEANLDDCIIWCRANVIPIDADKLGPIHFSRGRQTDEPSVTA